MASVKKCSFSDRLKAVIFSLAMVIRIVMTIAATLKNILVRAENKGEKSSLNTAVFVKRYHFYKFLRYPKGPPKVPKVVLAR